MIRLCIDARMIMSSGIGTSIRNLLPFFSRPPFQTSLLIPHQLNQFSEEGLQSLLFDFPIYSLAEQWNFPWKVPSCDLFWSPHYNVPLGPIRSKHRVVTINDVCHLALPGLLSWPKRMAARYLLRAACQKSEQVVTISEFSQREISRFLKIPTERIEVIYCGVDKSLYRPYSNEERSSLIKKYALHFPFFFFTGNLKPHKNLSLLIKAFESFCEKSSFPHRLLIGGKSAGLLTGDVGIQELIKKSHVKERLLFLGEVPERELPLLYASAEAFVFPSLYEGFGLPPLEAMACGCPVLSSTAASLPEVCGEAASYFSPHAEEELVALLLSIANDPKLREQLAMKGRKRAEEFCWEKAGKAYRALFEKLCFNSPQS